MKHITIDELKQMTDSEGLVLQGCRGNLDEWAASINKMLTEAGVLLDGDTFKDVSAFNCHGDSCLLFKMDGVKMDISKLAMWRLRSHDTFGSVWLSDYLPNRLGVEPSQPKASAKPRCPMIGADGNVFNLMGIVAETLRQNSMGDAAKEMRQRVMTSGSYDAAPAIMTDYVEPVQIGHAEGEPDFDMEM